MAEPIPTSWRFVKASDISDGAISFDNLDVRSSPDESLGRVRGFIVDSDARRLHYVVVDSGGWFTGGTYLIPPAYTRIDAENKVLWTDLSRETISRFPHFDAARYPTLSRDELWQIERGILTAYGDDPGVVAPTPDWERDSWRHYDQPAWWRGRDAAAVPATTRIEPDDSRRPTDWPSADAERARPGDVLGIERAGETTALGETAEDEDERRRDAEERLRDLREDTSEEAGRSGVAADRPKRRG